MATKAKESLKKLIKVVKSTDVKPKKAISAPRSRSKKVVVDNIVYVETKVKGDIDFKIETGTKIYTSKKTIGSVWEFLRSVNLGRTNTITKITAIYKDKKTEKILNTANAFRLFTNSVAQEVFEKHINLSLGVK